MLPSQEFEQFLMEAASEVEKALSLEDRGWLKFGDGAEQITGMNRVNIVKRSRRYYDIDPLAGQAIRLWCDYSFGSGISLNCEDEGTKKVLNAFWDNPSNRTVFSAKGQRKSSDKLLVDGEVFFAIFLGNSTTIRWIDPLEITEIITDPDDKESVKYFKREWVDAQSKPHTDYYRSTQNIKDVPAPDSSGASRKKTADALVYHLAYNTTGQRGLPLLLRVLDWIPEYRRFLAARIAVVRAMARFAWKNKIAGGTAAVAAAKAVTDGKYPQAGSTWHENDGANLDPIKTDTGAFNAEKDGRMIKLQICAGLGLPEQYFGDIATGNLATAKTVELPMLKMFSSYQKIWSDAYLDILNVVFDYNKVKPDKRFVDIDFPEIAPSDAVAAVTAIMNLITAFPDLADSREVKTQGLLNIGLNNVNEILDNLTKVAKESKDTKLIKALKEFKVSLTEKK
ncbi:MAG: hypothetical protein JW901_05425 [Dehalococcoidia bacterium]|nr:hypothetical protein [Dehalococcoidia bacterium]